MAHSSGSQALTTAELASLANERERMEAEGGAYSGEGRRDEESPEPLLPQNYSDDMRNRWERIQTGFVDDPRVSVQQADELVAAAIRKLAESFAQERANLEQQWSSGKDVSTEDLRQALRRYRVFFQRLLAI